MLSFLEGNTARLTSKLVVQCIQVEFRIIPKTTSSTHPHTQCSGLDKTERDLKSPNNAENIFQ